MLESGERFAWPIGGDGGAEGTGAPPAAPRTEPKSTAAWPFLVAPPAPGLPISRSAPPSPLTSPAPVTDAPARAPDSFPSTRKPDAPGALPVTAGGPPAGAPDPH